jgi:hypothetical protein
MQTAQPLPIAPVLRFKMAVRRTRDLSPETLKALERAAKNGLIGYHCKACDGIVILLESNLGPMPCPYCKRRTLQLWGKNVEISFTAEDQIIDDGSNGAD